MDLFSPHGLFFPIAQAVSSLRAIRRIFRSARSSSTAELQQSWRSVSHHFIRSTAIIPQMYSIQQHRLSIDNQST